MKFLNLIPILLLLTACVEITDLERDAQEPQGPPPYHALEHPEPNRYSIVIPLAAGEVAYRKSENIPATATVAVNLFSESQSQIKDENVKAGKKYFYQIGRLENGNLRPTRTVEVHVPTDRVFQAGEQELISADLKTRYGRVYFMKGSRVRTNGANWSLITNRIISHGGEIYSFTEEATAGLGENGRSGGEISVSAREVIGVLSITMRGENGGKGKPGDEIPGRAPKGKAGVPGRGRRIPARSHLAEDYCTEPAVSPGNGMPGTIPGNRGYDGGRGGDSGNVNIRVTETLAGNIQTNFYEGLGGLPGDGGPGQRGGAPGDFDSRKNFHACIYKKAHEGPRGPQGEQGSSGPAGLRGTVCRWVGGAEKDCRQGI